MSGEGSTATKRQPGRRPAWARISVPVPAPTTSTVACSGSSTDSRASVSSCASRYPGTSRSIRVS